MRSFFLLCFLFASAIAPSAFAADFSSTHFIVSDPVIAPGGFSSSTSFSLRSVVSLPAATSSANHYTSVGGFLAFPAVGKPVVSAEPDNHKVTLSWTEPVGSNGWIPSGYQIGQSTTPSGPYTYTSVNINVNSSLRTGLTNNVPYYFVVTVKDDAGEVVATSSEIVARPVAVAYGRHAKKLPTAVATTTQFLNSNGTKVKFDFPANFTGAGAELNFTTNSVPKSTVTADLPLPAGKRAAETIYEFTFAETGEGESVTSVNQPVTLTFEYTDADIVGLDEAALAVYRWDGSAWVQPGTSVVNASANTVTVTTTQFSNFALISDEGSGGSSGSGSGSGTQETAAPNGASEAPTTLSFTGTALPLSGLTLYDAGREIASGVVGPDGSFALSATGLTTGWHTFSLYAADGNGVRSGGATITLYVTAGLQRSVREISLTPPAPATVSANAAAAALPLAVLTKHRSVPATYENSLDTQAIPLQEIISITPAYIPSRPRGPLHGEPFEIPLLISLILLILALKRFWRV